eukprot:CAMPEP_0197452608 /NCGR_PEP_ID=MMETSP1175-20131217/32491_1 /TAXON_ID=1003142 /ORGANISM="Triceratium dubium, Strain CCMP147" /LENGTH=82 /DNA_ID=CAMNT_0042985665 /DNA_START=156 /DNA_END=404 /DNA_ORIENTATION=+
MKATWYNCADHDDKKESPARSPKENAKLPIHRGPCRRQPRKPTPVSLRMMGETVISHTQQLRRTDMTISVSIKVAEHKVNKC